MKRKKQGLRLAFSFYITIIRDITIRGVSMKVIITGKQGYIGLSLMNWLLNKNDIEEVKMLDVRTDDWRQESFAGYDAIVHLAGIVHRKETPEMEKDYYKVNTELPVALAQKAKNEGVGQFIFMSTMAVYGSVESFRHSVEIDESTSANPVTYYGKSKLLAEEKLQQLQDDTFAVSVVRPPLVYGKNCPGNYQTLRKLVLKARAFPKVSNQRSMIFIDNLCELLYLILRNRSIGMFYPQNKELVSTAEMARLIAECSRVPVWFSVLPVPLLYLADLLTDKVSKAFGSLYYAPELSEHFQNRYCVCDFEESMKKTEQ
jgi:Nucleoside-diphosphate-sugar epimerases